MSCGIKRDASPFDLNALLAKLTLVEKTQEQKEEKGESKDEYSPTMDHLFGLRLRKPFLLKPYQLECIQWMKKREEEAIHGIRGGLWVVEMGLGKTLMTLVLVLSHMLEKQKAGIRVTPTL